ncbi:hypothetical protein HYR54_14600 [Candidatus Acetothermia bacterium]|nr:hypothetical protein [Candidatus Acetothermia bacterium]
MGKNQNHKPKQKEVNQLIAELKAIRSKTLEEIEEFDPEFLHESFSDPELGEITVWELLQQIRDYELYRLAQIAYINLCVNPQKKQQDS